MIDLTRLSNADRELEILFWYPRLPRWLYIGPPALPYLGTHDRRTLTRRARKMGRPGVHRPVIRA